MGRRVGWLHGRAGRGGTGKKKEFDDWDFELVFPEHRGGETKKKKKKNMWTSLKGGLQLWQDKMLGTSSVKSKGKGK
jgi:hypothetical protein